MRHLNHKSTNKNQPKTIEQLFKAFDEPLLQFYFDFLQQRFQ